METGPRPEDIDEQKPSQADFTRRRFLAGLGVVAGAAALGETIPKVARALGTESAGATTENLTADQITARNIEQEHRELAPTFADPEAEAIARDLGLEPARYFVTTHETADAINTQNAWVADDKLLPIFDPNVLEHAQVLEAAAKEFGIPANFAGLICMIESRGVDVVRSRTDARGTMQVEPKWHLHRFVEMGYLPATANYEDYKVAKAGGKSHHTIGEYLGAMNNPEASARVGSQILAESLHSTRLDNPSLPPNHPEIYARAAAGYNGGAGQDRVDWSRMLNDSHKYFQDVVRFETDAEVAARLRSQGKSDQQIATAMQSEEVDALAFAYAHLPKDPWHVETFDTAANEVATLPDLPAGNAHRHWYEQYKAGHAEKYSPKTPAWRIWSAGGQNL